MKTTVAAPPPRDIAQEAATTQAAQVQAAGPQFESYAEFAPKYDQVDLQRLRDALGLGGEATVRDINNILTQDAMDQTTRSNRILREADLADVARFGGQSQEAVRSTNPELFNRLNAMDARAGRVTGPGGYEQQAAALAGNMPTLDTPFIDSSRLGNVDMVDASRLGRVDMVRAPRAGANPFLGGVMNRANSNVGPLQSELERQAAQELAKGGQLTDQEARDVINPIAAKYAARGLGRSNAVVAQQVLGLDAATRARRQEAQAMAAGVDAQGFGQRQALAGIGLQGADLVRGYDAMGLAGRQGNQQAQLSTRGQNLAAGQGNQQAQLGVRGQNLNAETFNQNAVMGMNDMRLRAQAQQFGQFGALAGMEAARRGEDTAAQQMALQGRLATFSDPFMGVLGRQSSNAGSNAGLFGMGAGAIQQNAGIRNNFDPFNAYASDLYNTNFNAQMNANVATANNRAGIIGGLLGMGGRLGGAYLGRG